MVFVTAENVGSPASARPSGTGNVPTSVRNGRRPEEPNRQFDSAIALRGVHERADVRALDKADERGPGVPYRPMIEIDAG